MVRVKRKRIIQKAPHFNGFRPIGKQVKRGEEVVIHFEEYEALNLCDYELMTQEEAAKMMNVSRPTFTRVYESARRKIAKAFVEGVCVCFDLGNADIVDWYTCPECKVTFTLNKQKELCCPLCKCEKIENYLI